MQVKLRYAPRPMKGKGVVIFSFHVYPNPGADNQDKPNQTFPEGIHFLKFYSWHFFLFKSHFHFLFALQILHVIKI